MHVLVVLCFTSPVSFTGSYTEDEPKLFYVFVQVNLLYAPFYQFSKCRHKATVEPRVNEPLYNEVLGITNDIQHVQSYSKMYGTGPRYNEPQYNEILVITNTIQKPKRKMYPDITNKMSTHDKR